jgi:NarL family two-component system sensor histidine kinase LiaS
VLRFFRTLRGKLILTYTGVTVLALLALEVLALGAVGGLGLLTFTADRDPNGYLTDIVSTLAPQARLYLQPGAEDLRGLQTWLEQVQASGLASLPPQYVGDSPAAVLVPGQPLFVLAPDRRILAQASAGGTRPGEVYELTSPQSLAAFETALTGNVYGPNLSATDAAGNYRVMVPVRASVNSAEVVGVIVVTVAPPPPPWSNVWPVVARLAPIAAGVVAGTAVVLLVAVAPFAALFGFVMSRGLTRRLTTLAAAADAWSEGDFRPLPADKGGDEISQLARRLRHMAERIQALLQSQQQLAALQERNRLARELHDTVKQQSFATLMQVRAARNRLADDPAGAEPFLHEAEQLLKTSQQELGRLIAELRPAALEGQGLAAALRTYTAGWAERTRIPASVRVQNERALPLETEQALYRVAQEALANAARHSRASAVTVGLDYSDGCVRLAVEDNGVGFDPRARTSGFGLESMRQRLAALGGTLRLESSPAGTCLTAEVQDA